MGAYPFLKDYAEAIVKNSRNVLSPDFELSVHGVSKGTFELSSLYNDSLNNREIIENFITAAKEGYDAIATGCFLDPCLHEAREILDIPIASLGEVSMHTACMYGEKFGIVTPGPLYKEKFYEHLLRKYGLEYRCAGMHPVQLTLDQHAKGFSDPRGHIKEFMTVARKLIDQGADVIISGCGILNALLSQNKISQIEDTGVPFVDGSSILMKTAEAMILMQKAYGTKVSRKGYYKSPSNFRETRKIYGL
jgi:Asp/Glu/hydantoin racemase